MREVQGCNTSSKTCCMWQKKECELNLCRKLRRKWQKGPTGQVKVTQWVDILLFFPPGYDEAIALLSGGGGDKCLPGGNQAAAFLFPSSAHLPSRWVTPPPLLSSRPLDPPPLVWSQKADLWEEATYRWFVFVHICEDQAGKTSQTDLIETQCN